MYVSYDIKGIQQFIFSVPKLKCMIGASGLIDKFDQGWKSPGIGGVTCIFAGGGHGAFSCKNSDAVHQLKQALIQKAGEFALDLRLGQAETLPDAVHAAEELYPPNPLAGRPCAMSGLWPVEQGTGRGRKRDVHPKMWLRREHARSDDALAKRLIGKLEVPGALTPFSLSFFKNVTPQQDNLLEELDRLEDYDEARVQARILPSLKQPWSQRTAFIASIAKRHPLLMDELQELRIPLGKSWHAEPNESCRATRLPDALLLLDEEHRMKRPTAQRAGKP